MIRTNLKNRWPRGLTLIKVKALTAASSVKSARRRLVWRESDLLAGATYRSRSPGCPCWLASRSLEEHIDPSRTKLSSFHVMPYSAAPPLTAPGLDTTSLNRNNRQIMNFSHTGGPEAALIVAGDFSQAGPGKVLMWWLRHRPYIYQVFGTAGRAYDSQKRPYPFTKTGENIICYNTTHLPKNEWKNGHMPAEVLRRLFSSELLTTE